MMNKILRYVLFTTFVLSGFLYASGDVQFDGKNYYFSNKLKIKLTEAPLSSDKGAVALPAGISNVLKNAGVNSVEKTFFTSEKASKSAVELSKVVTVTFSAPYNVKMLAHKLQQLPGIEIAEPYYLDETTYDPNDPNISAQYHIAKIIAKEAWDVTKGSPDVVIAIDDTGVDWNHPDLAANIHTNSAELNGLPAVDDDANGYIDDIRGWDFGGLSGTPDNDPMEDRPDHGTHVAGDAAQVTDNGVHGAGIGFNCSIMPVKTSQDDIRSNNGTALIAYGYQGIIYAVDNGARIINCSWGGYIYSKINQEVIDYAVENNVLVIAAAGNDNTSDEHYPSSYNGVISVASTTSDDSRSNFSNYGKSIDVSAPGSGILSTWQNDSYATLGGTSMSSPIVAGLAGLVATQFPDYNALQIGEQIRVNTDDISSINSGYDHLLGSGRVNAAKAVSNNSSVSVRATNITFIDQGNGNGVFEPGETVAMAVEFTNYLSPTSNLEVTIEHAGNLVTITNSTFNAGTMQTLASINNSGNLFTFNVNQTAPENGSVDILIKYSDGGYQDYQWANVIVNPTYTTQGGNDLAVTITSKGTLGFNDYSDNLQGDGFRFQDGENLLYEGAFMMAVSDSKIMDAARGADANNQDNDFKVLQGFVINTPGEIADQQGYGIFNDDNAGTNKIGVKVDLHTFTFANAPNDKNIILKYVIRNTSGSEITGFYAGLFFDWDVDETNYETNVTKWDPVGELGYVYNDDLNAINTHAAAALISSGDYNFYAINNPTSPNIYNGYSDAEKWLTLTSGTTNNTAGPADIAMVVSGGPYTIPADDFIDVAFVLSADTTLNGLQASVEAARSLYADLVTSVSDYNSTVPDNYNLSQNYPNPFNPATSIKYSLPEASFVKLKVFDVLGREVSTLVNSEQAAGTYNISFSATNLSSGIYFYSLETANYKSIKKMMLLK